MLLTICQNCGKPVPKNYKKFCPYCGASLIGGVSEIKNRKLIIIDAINTSSVRYGKDEYIYKAEFLQDVRTKELFIRFSYLVRKVGAAKWRWGSKREPILKIEGEFRELFNKIIEHPQIKKIVGS